MSPRSLTARIGFTLGALLIYRLGTYIPVPGTDPAVIGELYEWSLRGVDLLVVVWVILDTTRQVQWHLLERRHENASG